MITPILTFLSTRLVFVFITIVVVVAAVPTVIVTLRGNTMTVTGAASSPRSPGDDERVSLVAGAKKAGDAVIVELNDAEAVRDVESTNMAYQSKLHAPATAAA